MRVLLSIFFSCVGTRASGENAVGVAKDFFFFLCGHQGPPSGENAVGMICRDFILKFAGLQTNISGMTLLVVKY